MEIRRLTVDDDAVGIGRILSQSYAALPDFPEADYLIHLAAVRDRADEADVVVAFVDGEPAGCVTFIDGADNPHAEHDDHDAASFRYFAVSLRHQGRGIGEAMVRWCMDEARRLGRRRIRIHTLAMMTSAHRLYTRLGFVRDPDHDEHWGDVHGLAYVVDL